MSKAEADKLIEENRGLVHSIAQRIRAQLDLNCELDDLIAFGYHGLVEASSRFDPSRGVQFNTFAYYRIRGAVLDGVRKMAYMPRRAHAQIKAARALDFLAEATGDARAASDKARTDLEGTVQELGDVLHRLTASFVMASLGQSDEDRPASAEEALVEEGERARVRDALHRLPERERVVVEAFYFENRALDDIAKELGVSKSWASRIHSKALDLLRKVLEEK